MNCHEDIVAEVRRNREELLSEFGGDIHKLNEHLISQRPVLEAQGVRFVTEEEDQARRAWSSQRQQEEYRRIAAL